MPYIDASRRQPILDGEEPQTPGELTFLLFVLTDRFYRNHGGRYDQIVDVVGSLENTKLEWYRRVAHPYEDDKLLENGDALRDDFHADTE